MHDLVFDNCVLSNFALAECMATLKGLYAHRVCVTDFVLLENLRGIQRGHEKLTEIQKGIAEGWLRQVSLKGKEENASFEMLCTSLGAGEASCIAIARTRGLVFACDDRLARKEAALLGVQLTGTVGILVKAVRTGHLSLREANKILEKMMRFGFYAPIERITKGMVMR